MLIDDLNFRLLIKFLFFHSILSHKKVNYCIFIKFDKTLKLFNYNKNRNIKFILYFYLINVK